MKIYFDGGSRPGGMETAIMIAGRPYLRRDLGPGTSLDAEWLALLHAAELAQTLGLANPLFLGDSLIVVRQASGMAKCRGTAIAHRAALHALSDGSRPLRIRHVKRTQNLAGILLARLHGR